MSWMTQKGGRKIAAVTGTKPLLLLLLLLLSNIMHTSHVCVTLTSRIYFLLTLAQGKKAAPE